MKKLSLKKPNRSHLLYKDERIESKEITDNTDKHTENNSDGDERELEFCKFNIYNFKEFTNSCREKTCFQS